MASFRSLMNAVDAGTFVAPCDRTAPTVEAPAVERFDASEWAYRILGRYAAVATDQQRDHARYLLADDNLLGLIVSHVGPSFAELDAELADCVAPPAEFIEAVRESIGVVADLGPDGPVSLAEYLEATADLAPVATLTVPATVGTHTVETAAGSFTVIVKPKPVRKSRAKGLASVTTPCCSLVEPEPCGACAEGGSTATPTLAILGNAYRVEPIDPGEDNAQAVRLVKLSGDRAVYDVARTLSGLVACDCPDYTFKHEGTSSLCKHGAALVAAGLLDAPAESFADQLLDAIATADAASEAEAIAADLAEAFGPSTCQGLTPEMLATDAIPPGCYRLHELVRAAGLTFARWDNAAGDLIRDTLSGLADRIAESGASCVHEFDKLDALDDMARMEASEATAWQQGYRAAECESAGR